MKRRRTKRQKRVYGMIRTLMILLVSAAAWLAAQIQGLLPGPLNDTDGLTVHYIDVGQADAALLQCGGHNLLIDGGNMDDGGLLYDYMKRCGVEKLDAVIATHPHEDHVGGISGAMHYAKTAVIYSPVETWDSYPYKEMMKAAQAQGTPIRVMQAGDRMMLGDAEITCVGPIVFNEDEVNDLSLVVRVDYGETSFLFTGDAETAAEQAMIGAGMDLNCDVLKVGHHGSRSSSSSAFLAAVTPEIAVISVGEDNSYGHPAEQVLSRLTRAEAEIYRTDMQGTVIARSDGKTVQLTTEKAAGAEQMKAAGDRKSYVLNTSSRKFHLPQCSGVERIGAGNRQDVKADRQQLLKDGYEPCGTCKP